MSLYPIFLYIPRLLDLQNPIPNISAAFNIIQKPIAKEKENVKEILLERKLLVEDGPSLMDISLERSRRVSV